MIAKKFVPVMEQIPDNVKITKKLVEGYGRSTLDNYRMQHITIEWSTRMRKSLGIAYFRNIKERGKLVESVPVKIVMSSYAFERLVDKRQAIDTVLHEVAHILAGFKAGHNYVWKQWCMKVGANPERLADYNVLDESKIDYKWSRGCSDCNRWNHFHRKPKLVSTRKRGYIVGEYIRKCRTCGRPSELRQNF
jgi:hypothetical protein